MQSFPSHSTYLPTNSSFVWIAWEWYLFLSLYLYNENYYDHIIYSIPPFFVSQQNTNLRRKPLKCTCVCVKEKKLEGEVIDYERRSCCFRLKCYLPLRCIPNTHASVYFSAIFYFCHLSKTLFLCKVVFSIHPTDKNITKCWNLMMKKMFFLKTWI